MDRNQIVSLLTYTKKLVFEFIMADDDADVVQTEFATYEDYLDSQIKPVDMFYLGVRSDSRAESVFCSFW
jgi:hypothetical protein